MQSNSNNASKEERSLISIRGRIVFLFVIIITISFYVQTVQAGLSSYLNSLLTGDRVNAKVSAKIGSTNLQTIPILVAAVHVDPDRNKPYGTIPISGGETLVPDLVEYEDSDEYSNEISIYTVKDGDTISGVAKMFNVSVNTVIWANNLNSKSILKVGQTLIILPVTGIVHIVEKNENISSIAKRYGASADDIYSFNDITSSSVLFAGQKIIVPYAEAIPRSPATNKSKTNSGSSSNLPSYSGYYACPVPGSRMSQGLHGRNAVDLAAPKGTPVYSSAAGTVIVEKSNGAWNGGYGNFVAVSHDNGSQTLYSHMSSTNVTLGQKVTKGQRIGYIGSTGLSTGPHLHFEVRGARNPFLNNGCN